MKQPISRGLNPSRKDRPPIAFVSAGEILIDFIATEPSAPLAYAGTFGKFFGGASANVAVNLKNLGIESTIVAKVGDDGLGTFLLDFLTSQGIDTRFVTRHPTMPTSISVLTSQGSPAEFAAYREADTQLLPGDIPAELIDGCTVFHTTAYSIFRNPNLNTILDAYKRAHEGGKITSFDPNYSPVYWPDRDEALEIIGHFLACTTFCKPSLDDCTRLFGDQPIDENLHLFHERGVRHVMLTRGERGALLSTAGGDVRHYEAQPTPDLIDPTGAGDAFTAGFFATYLKTGDLDKSMTVAIKTAAFSLRHLGAITPLPRVEKFF